MKSLHLWLLASFFLGTSVDLAVAKAPLGWFRPVRSLETVFRAQSDEAVPTPPSVPDGAEAGASGTSAGTTNQPLLDLPPENTWNAFSPPMTSDPFLAHKTNMWVLTYSRAYLTVVYVHKRYNI